VAKNTSKSTEQGGSFGVALSPFGRIGAGDGWAIPPAWRFPRLPRAANDNKAPLGRRLLRWAGLILLTAACYAAVAL
jgi:hypothetical protein